MTVSCPYCERAAELVTGKRIYPHRPDLEGRRFWLCAPCKAWVGTHIGSKKAAPLGRLANAELRKAKMAAHAAFDPLWKAKMVKDKCGKGEARRAGYAWLAKQLDIDVRACHIGSFDIETCHRVAELCT